MRCSSAQVLVNSLAAKSALSGPDPASLTSNRFTP